MTYKVLAVLAILAVFMVGSAAMALQLQPGVEPGSIGDRVWWDKNGDGNQDAGEPGLVGVTVNLLQGGTAPIATETTGADGYYLFTDLPAGTYQVTVDYSTLPTSVEGVSIGPWVQTYDLNGIATPNTAPRTLGATQVARWLGTYENEAGRLVGIPNPEWNDAWTYQPEFDGFGNPTGGTIEWDPNFEEWLLTVVEDARDVDFGYDNIVYTYNLGAIGDYVWKDLDKDGEQDAGEPGIEGAVVELTQDSNFTGIFGDTATYNGSSVTDAVDTRTTNASGGYLFDNLPAGNYRVIVLSLPAPPSGSIWQQTFDKDDGKVPVTFFTPNEMANQLLASHEQTGADGNVLVWVDRVLDVDFGYVYKTTQTGPFFTYTQGGWGAKPAGNNPGMLLKNNWTTVFGSGALVVGSGVNNITLTSAKAVENFLPQGGTAGKLTTYYTNPTKTSAGVFAGQVTALKLSVLFSQYSVKTAGLGNLVVVSGPCVGKTVSQVLGYCEAALSGLATPYTIAQLNTVATAINENFDNGTTNNGYLAGP